MTQPTLQSIAEMFDLAFNDLLFRAHSVHREHFNPLKVQTCNLLSIKTGACPEDCTYCAQSVRNKDVEIQKEKLLDVEKVRQAALKAKENGSTRFCMGAAWRTPPTRTQFAKVIDLCKEVKEMIFWLRLR